MGEPFNFFLDHVSKIAECFLVISRVLADASANMRDLTVVQGRIANRPVCLESQGHAPRGKPKSL
jgi:hypothetical protein